MSVSILIGDALTILKKLPAESVHCVVTSPPYWQLRDYGTAEWIGGDATCQHVAPDRAGSRPTLRCSLCGASRLDKQIGLEATPAEYIRTLVKVFRQVRRVLRSDGICWVNMGDTYASDSGGYNATGSRGATSHKKISAGTAAAVVKSQGRTNRSGLKPKDLVGMPWRLALALQADGWWLRQDIIWAKNNPMPESCRDRCTKSHEYVFLLSKSEQYFYDQVAIREPVSINTHARLSQDLANQAGSDRAYGGKKHNGPMKAVRAGGETGVGFGHGYDPVQKPRVKRADGAYADGKSERLGRGVAWRDQNELANIPAGWATGTDRKHRDLTGNFSEARKTLYDRREAEASGVKNNGSMDAALAVMPEFRNKRSVWTISTEAFKDAHFATFPTALVEPCIMGGTSAHGCCPDCLTPWGRCKPRGIGGFDWRPQCACYVERYAEDFQAPRSFRKREQRSRWSGRMQRVQKMPGHSAWPVVPATVLDPFGGAGTTGLVADRLRRDAILIELNEKYAEIARARINREAPLFAPAAELPADNSFGRKNASSGR